MTACRTLRHVDPKFITPLIVIIGVLTVSVATAPFVFSGGPEMVALMAKIIWMASVGASAGPALVIIPVLLVGAATAAFLSLRPYRSTIAAKP